MIVGVEETLLLGVLGNGAGRMLSVKQESVALLAASLDHNDLMHQLYQSSNPHNIHVFIFTYSRYDYMFFLH